MECQELLPGGSRGRQRPGRIRRGRERGRYCPPGSEQPVRQPRRPAPHADRRCPPFQPVQLFSSQTVGGVITIIKSWGITVENSRPEAALLFVNAQGPSNGVDPPNALTSGSQAREHEPTLIILPDNKTLTVDIVNLDTASPILVTFSVCGWTFPAARPGDGTLDGAVAGPGYGLCNGSELT